MSKTFKYVKEFEFPGYAKGGKTQVKRETMGKVSNIRKESKDAVTRGRSAMQVDKAELNIPGGALLRQSPAFSPQPMVPMKKGGQAKVEKVMHEFKTGKLHSGSKKGPEVSSRKQAIAIALSEARKAKKK